MRGMVFGADADKLIVLASEAEVRKFTANQHVDVVAPTPSRALDPEKLRDGGWQITPRDDRDWQFQTQSEGRRLVRVVYKTLCGCERVEFVDFDQVRGRVELQVPVQVHTSVLMSPTTVVCHARRFAMIRWEYHNSGARTVIYREVS